MWYRYQGTNCGSQNQNLVIDQTLLESHLFNNLYRQAHCWMEPLLSGLRSRPHPHNEGAWNTIGGLRKCDPLGLELAAWDGRTWICRMLTGCALLAEAPQEWGNQTHNPLLCWPLAGSWFTLKLCLVHLHIFRHGVCHPAYLPVREVGGGYPVGFGCSRESPILRLLLCQLKQGSSLSVWTFLYVTLDKSIC